MNSGDPLLDLFLQGGAIGVLAFVVIAFMKGWIVSGVSAKADIEQCRKERDRALDLVYEQAQLTRRALDVTEKVRE